MTGLQLFYWVLGIIFIILGVACELEKRKTVRGATLVGKGSDVLMKIDRVGPRMWMAQGMCGSVSGSVPVNVGQPRIRISAMTVGGKGGKIEG